MITKQEKKVVSGVVVRFVGDSGDGMQLTGMQFADTSAMFGNDIATFPNFPAEIRAPQGSLYGVSGFQVHFGSKEISNPGDDVDLLVAMNPAGLKTNLEAVKPGQTIIVDADAFSKKNLDKAKYESNPLTDGSLENYRLIEVSMTSHTKTALKDFGLDNKSILLSKNMFALGMVYWIYNRSMDHTISFLNKKFAKKPKVLAANIKVLKAGFYYAETLELISSTYSIEPANLPAGEYRILNGNTATAWGLMTAANNILHELSKHKSHKIYTFQAEDEIAGVSAAIGASFAGSLGITTTSGPGLALKSEALGLALSLELPLVVVNVQRGGPSTGLPTKTEQSDLLQAMYGRSGESPLIIVAASTPGNCFEFAYEAAKLSIEHMTPSILLTDGYIANGSAPWQIRKVENLPDIAKNMAKTDISYQPYERENKRLARAWAVPGTPGLEHRIGGLEKDKVTGGVSYDPSNHEYMVKIRQEKINRVAEFIPDQEIEFAQEGDLLVVGWGGTYGSLLGAVKDLHEEGLSIGLTQFNYINPLPSNTEEVLKRFKKVIVCELNHGQFSKVLSAKFHQINILEYHKIQGLPFTNLELVEKFKSLLV